MNHPLPVLSIPDFELEGLANRNSNDYLPVYGLDPYLSTMFRGTLRYRGTAKVLQGFRQLGLFESLKELKERPKAWKEVLEMSLALTEMDGLEEVVREMREPLEWFASSRLGDRALLMDDE